MATTIGAGAVILFWVVVIATLWLTWNTILKARRHFIDNEDDNEALWKLPSVLGLRAVMLLALGLTLYYLPTTWNSEVRPQHVIRGVVTTSDRRSEEVPFVTVTNVPTWDQKMATNRAQNETARKEFDKLPNKQ